MLTSRPLCVFVVLSVIFGCDRSDPAATANRSVVTIDVAAIDGPVYVAPGQNLQAAVDLAASASKDRRLVLRPGVHQTESTQFCLLALTSEHDGVVVEGMTGAELSARSATRPDHATVAHVIYCGHGLSSQTLIRNLKITGAKGLATNSGVPDEDFGKLEGQLNRGLFFFMDGGAVKIFGRSSPVFEDVEFSDNETRLCGGAVSVEQQGFGEGPATFRSCRFFRNRCPATGAAVDVLEGSFVQLENCLFVDNVGNYGMDSVLAEFGLSYNETHGSGALTVFPNSTAIVDRCTFTRNWNAVDDHGKGSQYTNSIFVSNNASDGSRSGHPYEVDVVERHIVRQCIFNSDHADLQGTVDTGENTFTNEAAGFDGNFVPSNPQFHSFGFRPKQSVN